MLRYQIVDNAKDEWVVFVHGIGGSTRTWKKQLDMFSEKYNLLLLDLPGHGENANKIIRHVDVDKLNRGIIDTMDAVGITKAHFVGLSLGTLVILSFAIVYPERVNKIILGGAAVDVCGIYRFCVRAANWVKGLIPFKVLCKFFAWFLLPRKNHQKSRVIFVREALRLNKTTMLAWMEYLKLTLHSEKIFNQLNRLNKNVLFIIGDEDHCFIKGSKHFAKHLKNSTMKIIEHCGHVCSIEQAKIFNVCALQYLAA